MYLWMFWCGNIVLLTSGFFYLAKFTLLTPLSLLSWCRLSFPIVGLKIPPLLTLALKSPNRIFIWYWGKWSKTYSNSSNKLSFETSVFSSLGACALKTMISHQRPLRIIYDILTITKSTLLTADTFHSCTKKTLFPIDDSFPIKKNNPLVLQCLLCPI